VLVSVLGCEPSKTSAPASESAAEPVRLVLQITVDGLRGDLLRRYGDRFGEGGFRHLLEKGAVYANAHYRHANTETIVGHATLATGASPAQHGMIGNVWFDREAGELAYNIEDPEHPILPTREEMAEGAQIDPAQKQSRTQGRSPRSLLASTFGDELFTHTAGGAKVFGVSGKDRSAVSMAGHVGKAFWYSTDSGDMVTSSYYYDAYPDWVVQWNARRRAESHAGGAWALLEDASTYLLAASDDRPYETDLKGYGRVFPHPFGASSDSLFFTRLLVSPVDRANEAARSHFGIEEAVRFFFRPYLYLEREKIRASGADPDEVEQVVAAALTDMDGIALAVARSALPTLADTDLIARVRRNAHTSRSGDVYVAQEPYWFLFEKGPVAVMHGSPWRYDTYVPILFAGPGIAPRTIHRRVHPVDIAATLAATLGIKPPSGSVGAPLGEVIPSR
jgi:hypothetical protein